MSNDTIHFPSGPVDSQPATRPRKKRIYVNEQAEGGGTAPGGQIKRRSGPKRKPEAERKPFIHGPVKVDPDILMTFATLTRYADRKHESVVRAAMANVIFTISEAKEWPQDRIWDSLGRWNGTLRAIKDLPEVSARHSGWRAVQRVRVAFSRARANPTLADKLGHPLNQFIHEALLAMDMGLERILQANPSLSMSGEELAGMAPPPDRTHFEHPLFKKPPSMSYPNPADQDANESGNRESVQKRQLELDLDSMPHKSTEQVLQASEDRQSQVNQLVPIEATKAEDGALLISAQF